LRCGGVPREIRITCAVPPYRDDWPRDQAHVAGNLESLGKYAKPDELETARMILLDYMGEVAVTEDTEGVYGLVRMSGGAGYKSGAQEGASGSLCMRARR
jgi:hypothetical protein